MNGILSMGARTGLPATAVIRLTGKRPVDDVTRSDKAEQALLAAVTHPPRIGEARAIGALLPKVLADYGVTDAREQSLVATIDCTI